MEELGSVLLFLCTKAVMGMRFVRHKWPYNRQMKNCL